MNLPPPLSVGDPIEHGYINKLRDCIAAQKIVPGIDIVPSESTSGTTLRPARVALIPGFWGVVEFGDGKRVENLNTYPERQYLQINLGDQTVEEIAGPPPSYPRTTDGVLYREKAALFGICYIDRGA